MNIKAQWTLLKRLTDLRLILLDRIVYYSNMSSDESNLGLSKFL